MYRLKQKRKSTGTAPCQDLSSQVFQKKSPTNCRIWRMSRKSDISWNREFVLMKRYWVAQRSSMDFCLEPFRSLCPLSGPRANVQCSGVASDLVVYQCSLQTTFSRWVFLIHHIIHEDPQELLYLRSWEDNVSEYLIHWKPSGRCSILNHAVVFL